MKKYVKDIVIVGGGTSAWMAAAYLSNARAGYNVTVIDKENGAPIGVGEATILGFADFLGKCGFEFDDWFYNSDGMYKAGILFPGWGKNKETVWHPFYTTENIRGITLHDLWSKVQDNQELDYKQVSPCYHTSMQQRVDLDVPHAHHVNAGKLSQYIKERIIGRPNVRFVASGVETITHSDEDNSVESLVLANGMKITGDLFVDCTGFKSILKKKRDRVTLEGRLFCDTAVATRVQYLDREKEIKPYTTSGAVSCGWIWEIPLRTRIGTGLVFNRSFTTVEEAKKTLIEKWDNRIAEKDIWVIDWTPYYDRNIWDCNVVSIGLSAGFIEPLESTGIALICQGITLLEKHINNMMYTDKNIGMYNTSMTNTFEECVDFVSMHYHNIDRDEPFWMWVKENYKESDSMRFYLDVLLNKETYKHQTHDYDSIFGNINWLLWCIQKGYRYKQSNISVDSYDALQLLKQYANKQESQRYKWCQNVNERMTYIEAVLEK